MYSEEDKTKRNLRLSFYDGIFASAMVGFTQEYLAPFLISINATVRQIGILTAVPNLLAALLQIKSAELSERLGSRVKVLNIFVFLQAVMILPMALVTILGRGDAYAFILFVTLFTSFGAFATPAWGSMMSDIVPEDKRGEYFGWRNMLTGLITISSMFLAGLVIHYSKGISISVGFALIFCLAFIFRMISWSFLRRMYEPSLKQKTDRTFTLTKFLLSIKGDNFARFVVSVSLMNFSVNLAGPFFAVLMLRNLGFSYLLYTIITVTASLAMFMTIRRWGLHADRVGNIKIIKSTSFFISTIPLLWIVNQSPCFLIFAQIYSGFIWAGFNLSAANFIYDAVPSQNRTKSIAYFNVIHGFSLFAGAITGGFLINHLPPILGNRILTLLLLSAIMRFVVSLLMLSRLQEVRPVVRINSSQLFFSIVGVRPLLGIERKTLRY